MTDAATGRLPLVDYDALDGALATADAEGFVHAGSGADPDLRYLTGVADQDERAAFGYVDGTALLALSADSTAPSTFPGRLERVAAEQIPAARIATWLAAQRDGGRLAVPRQLPHDAAHYLQDAGFTVTSTAAVSAARAIKTAGELDAVTRAADAAVAGIERARELLANASARDGGLALAATPVTDEQLRREIDAAVVLAGGHPAGNTHVETDFTSDSDEPTRLRADEPIRVALAPRDPAGYHAPLARTLTVDAGGGWGRRAHVACESARRAGIAAAQAGEPAAGVAEELLAELGAYGFDPDRAAGAAGGGVGLSRREQPSLTGSTELQAGMVLALTPTLIGDEGTVGLTDTVVIEDDQARVLTQCATSLNPDQ